MRNIILFLYFTICTYLGLFSQKEKEVTLKNDNTIVTTFGGKLTSFPSRATRTGYVEEEGTFFQITLIDANHNKKFTDVYEDYIVIEHKKTLFIRGQVGVSFQKLEYDNRIQADGKVYRITEIDPEGQFLKLKEIASHAKPSVKLVNKLPDLDFKDLEGGTHNFRDYVKDKKYVFVEFWGTWCGGCLQILPSIKETYQKHKKNLTVIYLNSRDEPEDAKAFLKKHQIEGWVNGLATKQLEKEFLLNGYPYGVLFDRDGKVIKFACGSRDLEEFLDECMK